MKPNKRKAIPIVRNANGTGDSSVERNSGSDPNREIRGLTPGAGLGRGWAALYLAAKFEKALVVLESHHATPGAVDRIEAIRNRAQAG